MTLTKGRRTSESIVPTDGIKIFYIQILKYKYISLLQHTFNPDVAVPLEVVVGSFPGVPVVSQKSDRWSRLNRHVTYSFLICRIKTNDSMLDAFFLSLVRVHYAFTYQHILLVETRVAQRSHWEASL